MEPLFTNSYEMTRDDVRELEWDRGRYTGRFICLGLLFALLIVTLIQTHGDHAVILALLLCVLMIAMLAARYFKAVKLGMGMIEELARGGPAVYTTVFYAEGGERTNPRGEVTAVDYSVLRGVYVTKRLIILSTRAGFIYTLRRGAFTVGSEEEFLKFIRGKAGLAPVES